MESDERNSSTHPRMTSAVGAAGVAWGAGVGVGSDMVLGGVGGGCWLRDRGELGEGKEETISSHGGGRSSWKG